MQPQVPVKPVIWVGPSRNELKALPREVQRAMGIALWQAQRARVDPSAQTMRGARLHGVIEVRDDFDRRTYRLMYTTMFDEAVYVLCAFQKKAASGIKTPKRLLDLIAKRLRDARKIHALEART